MKKSILFLLLVFTSQVFGSQYIEDSNTFLAEALVWKLGAGSAENWCQEISPAGVTRSAKLIEVHFNWDPGLRLGIGHKFCDSDWDAYFSGTWFETKGSSQAVASTGGVFSSFLGNFFANNLDGRDFGPNYRSANIQWKVLFNIYDLELGRSFQIDQCFTLRPFFGIKGGFINHHLDSNWQTPTVPTNFTVATENIKNNFIGVGPSLGLNTDWNIYEDPKYYLNIFGNFSGAVLVGRWRFKDLYQNNRPTAVEVHLRPVTGAASMGRGMIGLEFGTCIAGANLTVRLGYEAQVWFNQLQYYSLNMGRLNSLMSLQGGVLGIDLKF